MIYSSFKLTCVATLAALAASVSALYSEKGDVHLLNPKNFEKEIKRTGQLTIVEFL